VFEVRHAELEARRKLLALQRDLARVRAQLAFKPLKPEELQ
jgi:outer membrane protein, heavy metal efflux system